MAATQVKPLLFRPPPRWHWWTALGGAVAIHLTAVALAQRHEAPPVEIPPDTPTVVEATLMPPGRQRIFRCQSRPRRQRSSPSMSKKEHLHRGNQRRKNSRQSKALRCQCPERKPSPYTIRAPNTRTRRVRGTSWAVEFASLTLIQGAAM